MSNKKVFKLKKVAFQNNLLEGHPTQYKVAMVTPVVVNREKFVDNVLDHTGLHRSQVVAVLDAVEACAGDYMELGNAVQLGENLGTIKPTIRVKAFSSKDDCKASSVLGVGIRFIPTGRMRTRLADVSFAITGESDGTDVDDSEVTPNNPSGSGENGNGSGSGESGNGSGSGESGNGSGSGENGNGSGGDDDGDMG